jgi:hypothetical protein
VFQNLAPENQLIFMLLVGFDVDQPCCVSVTMTATVRATPANYGERVKSGPENH